MKSTLRLFQSAVHRYTPDLFNFGTILNNFWLRSHCSDRKVSVNLISVARATECVLYMFKISSSIRWPLHCTSGLVLHVVYVCQKMFPPKKVCFRSLPNTLHWVWGYIRSILYISMNFRTKPSGSLGIVFLAGVGSVSHWIFWFLRK